MQDQLVALPPSLLRYSSQSADRLLGLKRDPRDPSKAGKKSTAAAKGKRDWDEDGLSDTDVGNKRSDFKYPGSSSPSDVLSEQRRRIEIARIARDREEKWGSDAEVTLHRSLEDVLSELSEKERMTDEELEDKVRQRFVHSTYYIRT